MKVRDIRLVVATVLFTVCVALQLALAPVARAEEGKETGWFVDLGVGSARNKNEINAGIDVGSTNYVQRGYLGYRFSDYFGVEGGYVNFSTIRYTNANTGNVDTYDYNGFHGKVYLNVPFHRDVDGFYAVTVSGGGWRWDADIRSPGNANSHTTGTG